MSAWTRWNLSVHWFSGFGHSHSTVQFVSDMQSEVPQVVPAGVSKWCGRLPRVVDPHCQTPLYCWQEDTGILVAHDEHLLEGDSLWQIVNVDYSNQCWFSVLIVGSVRNPRNTEQSWWNQVDAWTSSADNNDDWHECRVDSRNNWDGKVHTRRVLGRNKSTSDN